jgi:NAD(P)-dependent dehydrogenase (short-subunit alcohol dehydrogenase family)
MNRFENSKILVVGASSGIGRAVAAAVHAEGATVYCWSRRAIPENAPDRMLVTSVDITDAIDADALELPDTLDGVVYAPGSIELGAFPRLALDRFRDAFEINLIGAVRVLQAVHSRLIASGNASVVLFSTVAVATGMQFHAAIASAKGAVEGLTRSLAAEFAAKNVRYNAVAPSLTDTPLAERLLSNEKKRDASAARHPLGRYGTVRDISAAVTYLLDPTNSWITGQILHVDGGVSSLSGM